MKRLLAVEVTQLVVIPVDDDTSDAELGDLANEVVSWSEDGIRNSLKSPVLIDTDFELRVFENGREPIV